MRLPLPFRRFRLTLLLVAVVILCGVLSRAHVGPLDARWRGWFGFAPMHLLQGDWHRIFTSLPLTVGGWRFYASVVMLTLGAGAAEWFYGSGKTALAFFGVHVATLVIVSSVLAALWHTVPLWWVKLLATARDVGPSAGYYGCLGLASWQLPRRWRGRIGLIALGLLTARVIYSFTWMPHDGPEMAANLAHLIAFPLGMGLGRRLVPLGGAADNVLRENKHSLVL